MNLALREPYRIVVGLIQDVLGGFVERLLGEMALGSGSSYSNPEWGSLAHL